MSEDKHLLAMRQLSFMNDLIGTMPEVVTTLKSEPVEQNLRRVKFELDILMDESDYQKIMERW